MCRFIAYLGQPIIVDQMRGDGPPLTVEQIQSCFQKTFDTVQQLKEEAGIGNEVSTFNMMVTDGY
jgi:hypothetical protein